MTACGFCEDGIYRGEECPYCGGSGRAPSDENPRASSRPLGAE